MPLRGWRETMAQGCGFHPLSFQTDTKGIGAQQNWEGKLRQAAGQVRKGSMESVAMPDAFCRAQEFEDGFWVQSRAFWSQESAAGPDPLAISSITSRAASWLVCRSPGICWPASEGTGPYHGQPLPIGNRGSATASPDSCSESSCCLGWETGKSRDGLDPTRQGSA